MTVWDRFTAIILDMKKDRLSATDLKPESALVEDLKLDSLDLAELLVLLENEFALEIDPDDLRESNTLRAVADYLEQRLAG